MTDDNALDELTPELRKLLNSLPYGSLVSRIGPAPFVETTYADGQGYWKPGDGTPGIVFDGPADANAAGRCVANRVRYGVLPGISAGSIHPSKCGWCDYPKDQLLIALDHAVWRSQFVAAEFAAWPYQHGERYRRSTDRAGEYDNPDWQQFWFGATPLTEGASRSDLVHARNLRREAVMTAAGYEPMPGARR